MSGRLPGLIDPLEFVEKKRRVKGLLPLSKMDRLRDLVRHTELVVEIELEFYQEGGIPMISGWVKSNLVLECQCCLEPLNWPVQSPVKLGIVRSLEEAKLLPESSEPLILEESGMIALADIAEDELLLAIPVVPQHSQCVGERRSIAESARHPFAILAQLKNKI
jgi:uncharacterized protein